MSYRTVMVRTVSLAVCSCDCHFTLPDCHCFQPDLIAVSAMILTRMSHSLFRYQPPPPTASRSSSLAASAASAASATAVSTPAPARSTAPATPFALDMKTPARPNGEVGSMDILSPASPVSPLVASSKRDAGKTLITASRDATIHLYDVSTPTPRQLRVLEGHTEWVTDVVWVADGSAAAAATTTAGNGAHTPRGGAAAATEAPRTPTHSAAVPHGDDSAFGSGLLISCSADTLIKVWTVNDGTCIKTVSKHTGTTHPDHVIDRCSRSLFSD